jgi:hypothetical protein
MSRGISAVRIYDEKPKGLDRFRAVYNGETAEEDLDPSDLTTFKRLRRAATLISENMSYLYVAKMFVVEEGLSMSHAYRIVRDSVALHGDVMRFDKEGQRFFMYEKLVMIAQKLEDLGNDEAAMKTYVKAGEIYGLFDKIDSNLLDAKKYLGLPDIKFEVIVQEPPQDTTAEIVE